MAWGARASTPAALGVPPKALEPFQFLPKANFGSIPAPVGGTPTGSDRDGRAPLTLTHLAYYYTTPWQTLTAASRCQTDRNQIPSRPHWQ
jgi:hypothetical protein